MGHIPRTLAALFCCLSPQKLQLDCVSDWHSSLNSPPPLRRTAAAPRLIRPALIVVNSWSSALLSLDDESPEVCAALMQRLSALARKYSLAILVVANGALMAESPEGVWGGAPAVAGGGAGAWPATRPSQPLWLHKQASLRPFRARL